MKENRLNLKLHITAFFLAALALFTAYALNGVYPFGTGSVLTADLQSQYIDVTAAFFDQLKKGENIFITYKSGLGSNLYAIVLYIMANPLSLLFLFFDKVHYQEIYFAVLVIKVGFAAFCFSVFAYKSKLLRLENMPLNIAFSLCYALCTCIIKYTINPMWIENAALLPLLFSGIEKVLEKGRVGLFLSAAALCFITNYYLAYMSGLFSIIYFAYFAFMQKIDKKQIFRALLLCGISAVLAIGTAMFVILPSLTAIANTYTEVLGVGTQNRIIKFYPHDIAFTFTHIMSYYTASGYPNAYCGISAILLVLAGFSNKAVQKREKIANGILCIFFALSLFLEPLYTAWHLFRAPTGFDGRFLYGVVLFILIFAIRSLKNADSLNKKALAVCAVIVFAAANYGVIDKINQYYILSLAALFVLLVIYCILLSGKNTKRFFAAVVAAEMFLAAINNIRVINLWDVYGDHSDYIKYTTDYKNAFDELYKFDGTFYRSDIDQKGTYNVSMSIGSNALNHFSSLANQKTFSTMRKLGVTLFSEDKVLLPIGQTVVLDSLFNVKYFGVMDKNNYKDDSAGRRMYFNSARLTTPYYKKAFECGDTDFYENTAVFPLMFAISDTAGDGVYEEYKYFENQNALFERLFDKKDLNLYEKLPFDEMQAANCVIEDKSNFETQLPPKGEGLMGIKLTAKPEDKPLAETEEETAIVKFTYTVQEEGDYCTVLSGEFAKNAVVSKMCAWYLNGIDIPVLQLKGELKDLGHFKKGDIIDLTYLSYLDTDIYTPALYRLNNKAFDEVSKTANENALKNIKLEKGNMTAQSDFAKERLVFSSIAYDKGLKVLIDGQEAEYYDIQQGFLGFKVPAGKHDIKIDYISTGAVEGFWISAVFAALSLLFVLKGWRIVEKADTV